MTREQEIKEMAKVKASHITSDKDMQVAFADALRSGAEWADAHPHWISVEDKLPPKKSEYDDLSNNILATDGKEIYESVYNHNFEEWFTHDMWGLDNITYWMPLPQPPHHFADVSKKVKKGGEG